MSPDQTEQLKNKAQLGCTGRFLKDSNMQGKMQKVCITIGAVMFIMGGAAKGVSGLGLLALGALGGGVGALVAALLGFSDTP